MNFKDVEIIVSDNSSTDETAEFLDFLQSTFSGFLIVNHNAGNLGFSGNIKKLVHMARGKYIFLCGDDDWYNKI